MHSLGKVLVHTLHLCRTVLREQWGKAKPAEKEQFLNLNGTGPFMMLPSDLALLVSTSKRSLINNPSQDADEYSEPFRLYADDQQRFFDAFAPAFARLLELGAESRLQNDYVGDLSVCKRSVQKEAKSSSVTLNRSLTLLLVLTSLSLRG